MAVADMWKGNKPPPPLKKDETSVALRLEKDKDSVDYFLVNIHKKISELDAKKGEGNFDYKYVTYGLVAKIYYWYGDPLKSAEYFYKDWVDYEKLVKETKGPIPWDDGHSQGTSLSGAFNLWEENRAYSELVKHYPELYEYEMEHYFKPFTDIKLLKTDFAEYKKNWPIEAAYYQEMMQKWGRAKKLAKTTKPKPLDPAVQHHEWFYSDKQEEVLKALEYYHNRKVRFMLEKALKHKKPVIAAKAREYLDTSVKEGTGNDKKK